MSTIGDATLAEMCRRIRRSTARGQSLFGMKFYEDISQRNEKTDDLPRVYMIRYTDKEEHAGGGGTGGKGINSIVRSTGVATLQLVVDKRNGWWTTDDTVGIKKLGLVNVKSLLLDAIESDDNGDADCSLASTADSPVMFDSKESGIFDLGLIMDIDVTLPSRRMNRAVRSAVVVAAP